ncbi:hypothetical protein [Paraburkholderia aromaticivorans]|uniref:Integrase n=1 Tax=Paraburkholderia aromaticivorans TaxID=2026199 RepID=A0A248VFD6_9BURK|nr:hypothetical protein [Paraburkholderia aromaticivorans]ASV97592.1 hypothetical protein CJU94_05085 [Paraburkholderia aromaticivorans]
MAYISQRGAYWRAEIRRRGYKPVYRTFDTKQQAQQWARRVESEMDSRAYVDRTEAERTTLRQALERYRREIVPEKRHPYQENRRIQRWIDNDLSHRTLANLRGADFAKYQDERRAAGQPGAQKTPFGSNFRSSATFSKSPARNGAWKR